MDFKFLCGEPGFTTVDGQNPALPILRNIPQFP